MLINIPLIPADIGTEKCLFLKQFKRTIKDGHSVSGLMVFSVLRPKRPDQKDRGLPRSYEFSYDHILNHDISSSSDRRETKHSSLDSP